jgi:hypothetical protein
MMAGIAPGGMAGMASPAKEARHGEIH